MSAKDRLYERMTPLLKRIVEKGPPGAACKVVRRGEVLYEENIGLADVESKRAIAPDTLYRIYSMTKVVTCVAALKLYEKGLYLLDDPIGEYMPAFANPRVTSFEGTGNASSKPASNPIRVKHLFTMTSGLAYGGEQTETERSTQAIMDKAAAEMDTRSAAEALAAVPLAFEPGARWRYGTSHDVLAAFVEAVSGQTFETFLRREIFEPLGMRDTSFRLTEENRGRLSTLYSPGKDGKLKPNAGLDACYEPGCKFEAGGSGLLSTIGDYSRFAQALAGGGELDGARILSPHTVALMATNHLNEQQLRDFGGDRNGYGYGLGVRVMMDRAAGGANGSVGHFGWAGLAGSYLLIDPAEELSLVYMQQMIPSLEPEVHPRLRNVVYGALD